MMKLSSVFRKKIQFKLRGVSKLIACLGLLSIWGSQSNLNQQKSFHSYFIFLARKNGDSGRNSHQKADKFFLCFFNELSIRYISFSRLFKKIKSFVLNFCQLMTERISSIMSGYGYFPRKKDPIQQKKAQYFIE